MGGGQEEVGQYLWYGTRDGRLFPILKSTPLFKDWDWGPLIHSILEVNGIPPPSDGLSTLVRKSLSSTHS
jgi:hypothetical protein